MFEMNAIDECVSAKRREMNSEGLADEILSTRLLPRFGAALRRLQVQRAGKSARSAKQHEQRFAQFSDLCTEVLGYAPLQASPELVGLALMIMRDNDETPQRIRDMKAAIAWVHRNAKNVGFWHLADINPDAEHVRS